VSLGIEAPYKDRLASALLIDELNQNQSVARLVNVQEIDPRSSCPVLISPTFDGELPSLIEQSIVVATKPLCEGASARDLRAPLNARGIIACDPTTAALFRQAGIPTFLWSPRQRQSDAPPVQDPLFAGLSREARRPLAQSDIWSLRPIDFVFRGAESEVRGEFLGRNADLFASLSSVIDYRRDQWTAPSVVDESLSLASYLGRRTKLVLNLPVEEVGGLDWEATLLHGMQQGALVVSAPCLAHPFLRPGEHFIEESLGRLPKLIRWLLSTPDGEAVGEKIRAAGREALETFSAVSGRPDALAAFIANPEAETCFR